MAKYDWGKIRDDYEIHNKTYQQISDKFGCSRGLISGRAKKEGWNKQEIEQTIVEIVNAESNLREITEHNRTKNGTRAIKIEQEALRRLRIEDKSNDLIEKAIDVAMNRLEAEEHTIEIRDLNTLSQIGVRSKESAIGKMPTTQVNIQQNNDSSMTAPIIAIPTQETEETWDK